MHYDTSHYEVAASDVPSWYWFMADLQEKNGNLCSIFLLFIFHTTSFIANQWVLIIKTVYVKEMWKKCGKYVF